MRALAFAFLGLWLATVAIAQSSGETWRLSSRPTREAVRATVEGQLQALRAGKFDEAYGFASSGLRRQFTPPVFAAMIRRGYPSLLTHRRFEMGIVRDDRDRHAQVVCTIFDAREGVTHYRYTLVSEDDQWRIEAVVATAPEKQTGI